MRALLVLDDVEKVAHRQVDVDEMQSPVRQYLIRHRVS